MSLQDCSVHLENKDIGYWLLYLQIMFCQQKDCELYTLQLFCEDFKMSSESSGLFNHCHNQMAKKIYDNSNVQTCFS